MAATLIILSMLAAPQELAAARSTSEVLAEHEQDLARASGEAEYAAKLLAAANEMEREQDLETAISWLRELNRWNPREPAHMRALCSALARAGRHAEVSRLAIEAADQHAKRLGLEWDERGRAFWVPELSTRSRFGWDLHDVMMSWKTAAELSQASELSGKELYAASRAAVLEKILLGQDTSDVVPARIEVTETSQQVILERALSSRHPNDRRVAAAECVRRIKSGRIADEELGRLAELALVAQRWAQRQSLWFPDLGEIVEVAWSRGQLDREQQERYLSAMIGDVIGLVFPRPSYGGRPTSAPTATISLSLHASKRPEREEPWRKHVDLQVWLRPRVVALDQRNVKFRSALLERGRIAVDPVRESVVFDELGWEWKPGRHTLEVHGEFEIECGVRGRGEVVRVVVPVFVRVPFYGD